MTSYFKAMFGALIVLGTVASLMAPRFPLFFAVVVAVIAVIAVVDFRTPIKANKRRKIENLPEKYVRADNTEWPLLEVIQAAEEEVENEPQFADLKPEPVEIDILNPGMIDTPTGTSTWNVHAHDCLCSRCVSEPSTAHPSFGYCLCDDCSGSGLKERVAENDLFRKQADELSEQLRKVIKTYGETVTSAHSCTEVRQDDRVIATYHSADCSCDR